MVANSEAELKTYKKSAGKMLIFFSRPLAQPRIGSGYTENCDLDSRQLSCPASMKKAIITLAEALIMHYSYGLIRTMVSQCLIRQKFVAFRSDAFIMTVLYYSLRILCIRLSVCADL